MKKINTMAGMLLAAATVMFSASCENDNINPYDYAGNNGNANQGSTNVIKTAVAEYPVGSLVWSNDTTLSESVEIPVGTSLYIEPGVTVTCKADTTPIQRQISCNIQNNNKTCVNANIYSI